MDRENELVEDVEAARPLLEDNDSLCEKHQEIVDKSVRYITRVIFLALSFSLTYTMRTTIFTSYCDTFNDRGSDTVISIVLFSSYISSGCISLIFGQIADRWRFDHLIIIATILDAITFWIEATTTSFKTFAIVYVIGGQPIQSLVYGMFNRLLPIYNAQHISVIYGLLHIAGSIMGPLLAGIISYYTNEDYRAVFFASALIASILCIYSLFIVANRQKYIENEQLIMIQNYYHKFNPIGDDITVDNTYTDENKKWLESEHYRFPLAKIMGYISNEHNYSTDSLELDEQQTNVYSTAEITNVLLLTIMGGLIRGSEAGFAAYYISYLKSDSSPIVDSSTIIINGEGQIATTGIFVVIGSLLVKKLLKKYKFSLIDITKNMYIKCAFFSLIQGICVPCLLALSNNFSILSQINFDWIGTPFVGFCFGCSYLCVNIVLIQILPKRASGTIAGVRVTIYNFFQAVAVLCIGILMQWYIQWFWFIQAINYFFSVILLFVFVFVNTIIFKY